MEATEEVIRIMNLKVSIVWLGLRRLVGLVFTYLKRAFDTVDHYILYENVKFMVFKSESYLGLGLTFPNANNSTGLTTLHRS